METDTKLFLLKRLDLSPHLILAHHIVKNIAVKNTFLTHLLYIRDSLPMLYWPKDGLKEFP